MMGVSMSKDEMILSILKSGDISIGPSGVVWRHRKSNGQVVHPARRIDHLDEVGYRAVKLTVNGVRFSTSAHRIQWINHNGAIPEGLEVNHIDLDKTNNRIDNLEIVTHRENITHAIKGGKWPSRKGENNPCVRLTWEQVRYIREEVKAKRETQAAMAKKFCVNPVTIHMIVAGKNWKEPVSIT